MVLTVQYAWNCTEMMLFCFIYYIYSYYITTFDASKKKTGAAQQPDVEGGQWIDLSMLKFLCSVVIGKKGSSLRMSSRDFLELLH